MLSVYSVLSATQCSVHGCSRREHLTARPPPAVSRQHRRLALNRCVLIRRDRTLARMPGDIIRLLVSLLALDDIIFELPYRNIY